MQSRLCCSSLRPRSALLFYRNISIRIAQASLVYRGITHANSNKSTKGLRFSSTTQVPGESALVKEKSEIFYTGPLSTTFRNLKIFSLSSLTLASALTPFIFIIDAPLSLSARIALAITALGTSLSSTALIGWCGKPYVISMRRQPGSDAIELTTTNTFLRERRTTVLDPRFFQPTSRPFATWELPQIFTADIEPGGQRSDGTVEPVAITRDASNKVLGRWEILWHEDSGRLIGTLRRSGQVIRHFNVHEELLDNK
ncbi:hypothetical protein BDV93DRAFT_466603 [Ceratobasidium sp. AG-I]|nr:hypothetical protein BDV93DRAFT_466603 [Ceratobasidium sp. AG-I]